MIGSFVAQPREKKERRKGRKKKEHVSKVIVGGRGIGLWDKLHAVFFPLSRPSDGVYYWPSQLSSNYTTRGKCAA
jgi:hypothetical protein